MDSKSRHEKFVTGHNGGPLSQIYLLTFVCLLSHFCYNSLLIHLQSTTVRITIDFLFNWIVPLMAMTLYAKKLYMLAGLLVIMLALCKLAPPPRNSKPVKSKKQSMKEKSNTPNVKQTKAKLPERQDVRLPFITIYRSQMMILTVTAILAVDFPIFPRAFSKTETWGTSLMDLGVGSFVFSLGIVSSRKEYKQSSLGFVGEIKKSIKQTLRILLLGVIRLISVKILDYQEHVTEYGVHWNFFFTIGLLPLAFTLFNRIPPTDNLVAKAFTLAFSYEIALKNTDLMNWVLYGARTDLISQNKEGLVSFTGYLAIFSLGYCVGVHLMNPSADKKQLLRILIKWTAITMVGFKVLSVATEPSRRIVNLPYIFLVTSYNAGCLAAMAGMEYLLGVTPSPSMIAVNTKGELIFVLGNISTGVVNLMLETLDLSVLQSLLVLISYQGFLASVVGYFAKQR